MYFSSIFLILVMMVCNINYITSAPNLVSQVGDKIYCGTIECPAKSVSCKVTTKNDPDNVKIIVTREICKDESGKTLKENSYKKDNPSGAIVNNESGVGPEYAAQAAEDAALIYQQNLALQQQIQHQIQQQFSNLNFPFNPFQFK